MHRSFIFLCLFMVPLIAISQGKRERYDLDERLNEISALVSFNDSTLLAINDSGNAPELFVLNLKGEILKILPVIGAENQDWEALCLNENNEFLFIGDIGNNLKNRKNQMIYTVNVSSLADQSILALTSASVLTDSIIHYNDWEAMIYLKDWILLSKARDQATIYHSNNQRIGADTVQYKVLNLPGRSFWKTAITDACNFNDRIYLLTYKRILVYSHNWQLMDKIHLRRLRQYEGLCATNLGIFVACERNRILGKAKLFFIPW